jgi:phosphoglycerate kinase
MGHEVGKSLLEEDKVSMAKDYLDKYGDKIVIALDTAMAPDFADVKPVMSEGRDIPKDMQGLDIGPKTIELFEKELDGAKTVI